MEMKTINSVRRCRLCACEENFDSFCNIFDEDPVLNIEMKITKLLPIVVMPWDPMPHKICTACMDKLNSFDEFYENSLRAERFLRTLHPSAPQKQLDKLDPVVEVLEPPILGKVPFALPPKDRVPPPSTRDQPPPWRPGSPDTPDLRQRLRNCFVINELTSKDSIFTCRKCFRTFTKESSAWTHTCVRLEDCQEFGAMGVRANEGQKLLPPLKIRLFSMESGRFVCDLCQTPFEKKAELVAHIRRHLKEGSWSEEEKEVREEEERAKGKRRRCTEEVEEREDGEEEKENGAESGAMKSKEGVDEWLGGAKKRGTQSAKAARKRRKHCGKSGKKRTKQRKEELVAEDESRGAVDAPCNGRTSSGSSPKETVENTTRLAESVIALEDEIEIKYEKVQKVLEKVAEDQKTDETKNKEQDGSSEANKEKDKEKEVEEQKSDNSLVEGSTTSCILIEDDVIVDEGADRSEDVMVVQVVNSKTPTSFSSCVICDKVFATTSALIAHQKKHLQNCPGLKHEELPGALSDPFLCSVCAMTFSTRRTLTEHEQYHLVDVDAIG